jgi:alanine racemase
MTSTSTGITPEIAAEARRQPVAVIDLDAIRANYAVLAAASGRAECAAVVKGDGYGLGMQQVAEAAWQAGARLFFVARVGDGQALRRMLPEARIAVLDGLSGHSPQAFEAANLMPVLGTCQEVRDWLAAARSSQFMLHVDSGMNRLGLKTRELAEVAGLLRSAPQAPATYLTHFVSADDGDRRLCREQAARFEAAIAELPKAPRSITNSSGLFLEAAWRADITRPGKALYGIEPVQPGNPSPVRQALTVLAPILQVGDVVAGDTIGYSGTYRASGKRRIATLGIGYANGYLRSLSNKGVVAIDGVRVPVVGRVSMDLVTVDVSRLPEAALANGFAELTGPSVGLTELAGLAGSNEYELQISLGRSTTRIYQGA